MRNCCQVVAFSIAILVCQFCAHDSTAQTASDDAGAGVADSTAMVQRIAVEIESLLPKKYAEKSDEKKLVMQVARALIVERQAPKAIKLLEELALKDPSLPPKNLILAGISFATNNAQQGRSLLERVGADYREHPGVSLAFSRLALMQGRYFEAMALAENANELAQSQQHDEAVRTYYSIEAYNSMTVIEMRRNDFGRAKDLAQKWAALDPGNNEMFLTTAEIAFQSQEYSKSVELLDRRAEATKQKLPTEIVMAKWYRSKSDFKSLELWVTKAVKKHPENPVVQLEHAAWLLRVGKYDEVESVVTAFETKNGASLDSLSLKGRVAFGRGNYDLAAEQFGQIYSRQPNNFENSSMYVFSLLETQGQQNNQQGINLAQRNFQTLPNNQLAALAMSVALKKAGKANLSSQLLERAARMGEILPDTAFFMASKLNGDGRGLQAKIMLDSFMESRAMFLYRERAQELIDSIGADSLPEPKAASSGDDG